MYLLPEKMRCRSFSSFLLVLSSSSRLVHPTSAFKTSLKRIPKPFGKTASSPGVTVSTKMFLSSPFSTTTTTNQGGENYHEENLRFLVLDEPTESTQDEAKRLLAETDAQNSKKLLAVLANQQTNGRGTKGRTWEGKKGNVHLTIAVPLDQIPVTITLLPLQIGVLIANCLQDMLLKYHQIHDNNVQPMVKWPNDVLVDERKIAGVLIENWISTSSSDQTCWFLVGIGINVAFAPSNLPAGVRPAACLHDFYEEELPESAAQDLGRDLTHAFMDWILVQESSPTIDRSEMEAQVLKDWKSLTKFGQQYTIRETGEQVTTLDIQSDGQLKVRGADGRERLLVSDYFH